MCPSAHNCTERSRGVHSPASADRPHIHSLQDDEVCKLGGMGGVSASELQLHFSPLFFPFAGLVRLRTALGRWDWAVVHPYTSHTWKGIPLRPLDQLSSMF